MYCAATLTIIGFESLTYLNNTSYGRLIAAHMRLWLLCVITILVEYGIGPHSSALGDNSKIS